jgi:hypothetical protein
MRCLTRRSDIPVSDFREFWSSQEYIDLLKTASEALQTTKYSHQLTLQIKVNQELMDYHNTQEPFDGIIEFWWGDAPLLEIIQSQEARDIQKSLNEFEDNFIDRSASRFFFTEPD